MLTNIENRFALMRWPETKGAPVCPSCGSVDASEARRRSGALRFRCRGCKKDFTITTGTALAYPKMGIEKYIKALKLLERDISIRELSRAINCDYKTAWALALRLKRSANADR